jgi:hypothetical protein
MISSNLVHCLSQSQNNCTERSSLFGSSRNYDEVQLRGVRPNCPALCVELTIRILTPSILVLPALYVGELYVLNAEKQFHSTQCHCHSVLWHTDSHRIFIIFIFYFISLLFLPRERVSWTFFLLSLYCTSFLTRSLGFLELFSNSPLSVFVCHWSSLLPDRYENHLIWVDSSLVVPPWVSLALSTFGFLFWGPASCLTLPRTIWFEWTQSEQSPLVCSKFFTPECLLRTVNVYY